MESQTRDTKIKVIPRHRTKLTVVIVGAGAFPGIVDDSIFELLGVAGLTCARVLAQSGKK
jgi:hypothetical protein